MRKRDAKSRAANRHATLITQENNFCKRLFTNNPAIKMAMKRKSMRKMAKKADAAPKKMRKVHSLPFAMRPSESDSRGNRA